MKKIQIKKIELINFKGQQKLSLDLSKDVTSIHGANRSGKTTIFDAFTWLMFGKDSTDRKDFEIKTLDKNNVAIPKIEHEVNAVIDVDGEEISIKKILKENWVKKRGSLESEFSGNVTEYYWNEVPMQQKAFQEKVSQILDEAVFKMITNPLAFNAMKWQDRREALMRIAGYVSDADLAKGNSEYENLVAQLINGKTLEDYRKQIHASIKKSKEDLKAIPTRIDEVTRSMPEAHDFAKLATELDAKEKESREVDEEIIDKSKAFDKVIKSNEEKKVKASNLRSEIQEIESKELAKANKESAPDTSILDILYAELKAVDADILTSENALKTLQSKVDSKTKEVEELTFKMTAKRGAWTTENTKELSFNDEDFHCPTCKREFESGDVDEKKSEMFLNFKAEKATKLAEINKEGSRLKAEKELLEVEVTDINARIESGKKILQDQNVSKKAKEDAIDYEISKATENEPLDANKIYETALSINEEYKSKKEALNEVLATIQEIPQVDTADLKAKKQSIVMEIDGIKTKLQSESQIEAVKNRIKALETEESTLAQQIANVEKEQFVIENFNKLKIDTLESRINEKFQFVKFRMFETQINGGEAERCDALIDGVPFSDANTESKINAGIDIINTLCDFYQVTAPIFLDNRESVTEIIDTKSQLINLIVSPEDKVLRIE